MIAFTANTGFSNVSFKVKATHEQLGAVIQAALKTGREIDTFGTGFFKTAIATNLDVSLGGSPNWASAYVITDRIVYSINANIIEVTDPRAYTSKFKGTLEKFIEQANPINNLKKLEGKLLRFTYNGGTANGVRIIKLNEVKQSRGAINLVGVDLAHAADGADKGIRSYLLSKISGQIETLN